MPQGSRQTENKMPSTANRRQKHKNEVQRPYTAMLGIACTNTAGKNSHLSPVSFRQFKLGLNKRANMRGNGVYLRWKYSGRLWMCAFINKRLQLGMHQRPRLGHQLLLKS